MSKISKNIFKGLIKGFKRQNLQKKVGGKSANFEHRFDLLFSHIIFCYCLRNYICEISKQIHYFGVKQFFEND